MPSPENFYGLVILEVNPEMAHGIARYIEMELVVAVVGIKVRDSITIENLEGVDIIFAQLL